MSETRTCPVCGSTNTIDLSSGASSGATSVRGCLDVACRHAYAVQAVAVGSPEPGLGSSVEAITAMWPPRARTPARIACFPGDEQLAEALSRKGHAVTGVDDGRAMEYGDERYDIAVLVRSLELAPNPARLLAVGRRRAECVLARVHLWPPAPAIRAQLRLLTDRPGRMNFFSEYSLVSLLWRSGLALEDARRDAEGTMTVRAVWGVPPS
jgi:hypothetical protein